MRKTLLQINVTSNWGSHGKIAEDIGALAMTKGWHSVIAYGSIVCDRTASPELAGCGTCLVAESGNIDDVLRNITKLGQKTLEVTTNCRKRAVEYFDKTKCFTQYVDLYEELLSKKK